MADEGSTSGGAPTVGAASFGIGIDLAQFAQDLDRAEALARERAAQIGQILAQIKPGGEAAREANRPPLVPAEVQQRETTIKDAREQPRTPATLPAIEQRQEVITRQERRVIQPPTIPAPFLAPEQGRQPAPEQAREEAIQRRTRGIVEPTNQEPTPTVGPAPVAQEAAVRPRPSRLKPADDQFDEYGVARNQAPEAEQFLRVPGVTEAVPPPEVVHEQRQRIIRPTPDVTEGSAPPSPPTLPTVSQTQQVVAQQRRVTNPPEAITPVPEPEPVEQTREVRVEHAYQRLIARTKESGRELTPEGEASARHTAELIVPPDPIKFDRAAFEANARPVEPLPPPSQFGGPLAPLKPDERPAPPPRRGKRQIEAPAEVQDPEAAIDLTDQLGRRTRRPRNELAASFRAAPLADASTFALDTEPGPGLEPVGDEELASYAESLGRQYEENAGKIDVLENRLRGGTTGNARQGISPGSGIFRPQELSAYTDAQIIQIANSLNSQRAQGEHISASDPSWFEKAGLRSGSTELQKAIASATGPKGERQVTPTQAREDLRRLNAEQAAIEAAMAQFEGDLGGQQFYRPARQQPEALPFDYEPGAAEPVVAATSDRGGRGEGAPDQARPAQAGSREGPGAVPAAPTPPQLGVPYQTSHIGQIFARALGGRERGSSPEQIRSEIAEAHPGVPQRAVDAALERALQQYPVGESFTPDLLGGEGLGTAGSTFGDSAEENRRRAREESLRAGVTSLFDAPTPPPAAERPPVPQPAPPQQQPRRLALPAAGQSAAPTFAQRLARREELAAQISQRQDALAPVAEPVASRAPVEPEATPVAPRPVATSTFRERQAQREVLADRIRTRQDLLTHGDRQILEPEATPVQAVASAPRSEQLRQATERLANDTPGVEAPAPRVYPPVEIPPPPEPQSRFARAQARAEAAPGPTGTAGLANALLRSTLGPSPTRAEFNAAARRINATLNAPAKTGPQHHTLTYEDVVPSAEPASATTPASARPTQPRVYPPVEIPPPPAPRGAAPRVPAQPAAAPSPSPLILTGARPIGPVQSLIVPGRQQAPAQPLILPGRPQATPAPLIIPGAPQAQAAPLILPGARQQPPAPLIVPGAPQVQAQPLILPPRAAAGAGRAAPPTQPRAPAGPPPPTPAAAGGGAGGGGVPPTYPPLPFPVTPPPPPGGQRRGRGQLGQAAGGQGVLTPAQVAAFNAAQIGAPQQGGRGGGQGGGGLSLFGSQGLLGPVTGQTITRVGLGAAFGQAGLNILSTLAQDFHAAVESIAKDVEALEQSGRRVGVAFGAIGAQQFRGPGARTFAETPGTRGSQSEYQQTIASLAPLANTYQLTTNQVQQLTLASGELARIQGTDLAQSANALQGILRGNTTAGEALGLQLNNQYGQIKDVGASFDQLVGVYGRARAEQILFASVLGETARLQDNAARSGDSTTSALDRIGKASDNLKNSLANLAGAPYEVAVNFVANLVGGFSGSGGGPNTPPALPGFNPNTGAQVLSIPNPNPGLPITLQRRQGQLPAEQTQAEQDAQTESATVARNRLAVSQVPGVPFLAERGLLGPAFDPNSSANQAAQAAQDKASSDERQRVRDRQIAGANFNLPPAATPTGVGTRAEAVAAATRPRLEAAGVPQDLIDKYADAAAKAQTLGDREKELNAVLAAGGADKQASAALAHQIAVAEQEAARAVDAHAGSAQKLRIANQNLLNTPGSSADIRTFREQGAEAQQIQGALQGPQFPLAPLAPGVARGLGGQIAEQRQAELAAQSRAAAAQQPIRQELVNAASTRNPDAQAQLTAYDAAAAAGERLVAAQHDQAVAAQQAEGAQRAVDQIQAQSDLRRLSRQDELNALIQQRLNLEDQVAPKLLEQAALADQITLATRENLTLTESTLRARAAQLPTGAAVEQIDFEQRNTGLNITNAIFDQINGREPQADVGTEINKLIGSVLSGAKPRAEQADLVATHNVTVAQTAQTADQINQQLAAIPLQRQQQALQPEVILGQQQQRSADAQVAALERQLQGADLANGPDRTRAETALVEARQRQSEAASRVTQATGELAGSPPVSVVVNLGGLTVGTDTTQLLAQIGERTKAATLDAIVSANARTAKRVPTSVAAGR